MKNRAFVRYSKKGKVVPGSLILTGGSFPQGSSTWKEVPADLCAGPVLNSGPLGSFPWNTYPDLVVYCNNLNWNIFVALPVQQNPATIEELVNILNANASIYGVFSVAPGGTTVNLVLSFAMAQHFAKCNCDLTFEVFPD